MKVLQVNTVVSYGSTGIICQNIARGLIAQGHDCLTVYGRGGDVKGLVENILHFSKLSLSERKCFAKNALQYSKNYYNRDRLLDELEQLISRD